MNKHMGFSIKISIENRPTEMFVSVVSEDKSCVIYLFLILKQQFSAVGVFLLQVSLSARCGFPEAPSRCCHCFRPRRRFVLTRQDLAVSVL